MSEMKYSFPTRLGYKTPSFSSKRTLILDREYFEIDELPTKLIESEDLGTSSDATGLIRHTNTAKKINALYLVEFIKSEISLTI